MSLASWLKSMLRSARSAPNLVGATFPSMGVVLSKANARYNPVGEPDARLAKLVRA